jgi:peptide chain release factor
VLLMIWLQLTANTGPAECCLGVRKALEVLAAEAQRDGVVLDIVEEVAGPVPGTYRSVLLALEGSADAMLAARWCGGLQWICESPYRPGHKRKNWFLSGAAYAVTQAPEEVGEIRYEATRASGPGGQHVNKTDSAVRATHVATGLSVKVQAGRSQHACVFHGKLDTDSTPNWTPIPRQTGQSVQRKLDTDSTPNWTV